MSTLCLIMYVKSKYEMINPNQRNNEILKFLKTKVKFEISTLEIGYMQNFVKIRKLICRKCPNVGLWATNLQKQMTNLISVHSK